MAKKPHCHKKDRCRDSQHNRLTITRKRYEQLVFCQALLDVVQQYVGTIKEDVTYVEITPLRTMLGIRPTPPSIWDRIAQNTSIASSILAQDDVKPQPERE